jgi:MFS family permease
MPTHPAAVPSRSRARVRDSLGHSLRDVMAFSVMVGTGENYLSAYALFLKASAQDIAWLASIPSLFGSWAQLLSAWLGRRASRRKGIIVGGAVAQALSWGLILSVPWLAGVYGVAALIAIAVVYHACGNLIQPQWASLMGELVPEERRGRFFARRNRRASLGAFVSLAAAGAILDAFDAHHRTLLGFLLLFMVAGAARGVSAWHLSRMHDPARESGTPPVCSADLMRLVRSLPGTPFLHFSLSVAAMQGAVAIAAPFFAVLMLRDLGFSYLQFMALTATSVTGHFVTLNAWGRISDHLGNRIILVCAGYLLPLIPLLWLVSGSFWYLIGVQLVSGLAWGGFNLSAGNYLYDLRPGRPLAAYMAVHSVAATALVFTGAALGAFLGGRMPPVMPVLGLHPEWGSPLYAVLAVSALGRLAVTALLLRELKEVRAVAPASLREVAFRMARFNAVSVLVLDVVGVARRRR